MEVSSSINLVESVLQSDNKTITKMAGLLYCYGFDLQGRSPVEYINHWLTYCPRFWVRLAIVEALYQGRYKAISVDHILRLWKRRGNPTFHFPHEFERLVCRNVIVEGANVDKIESQSSIIKFQKTEKVDQSDKKDFQSQPLKDSHFPDTHVVNQVPLNIPQESESSSPTIDFNDETLKNGLPVNELVSLNIKPERSIHQFIPHSDSSQLYIKLRAAVHQELARQT